MGKYDEIKKEIKELISDGTKEYEGLCLYAKTYINESIEFSNPEKEKINTFLVNYETWYWRVKMELSNESKKLLKGLVEIYNSSNGEIYISSGDDFLKKFNHYEAILTRLNNNGFFDTYSLDIIGNIRIELSEKAFSFLEDFDKTDIKGKSLI